MQVWQDNPASNSYTGLSLPPLCCPAIPRQIVLYMLEVESQSCPFWGSSYGEVWGKKKSNRGGQFKNFRPGPGTGKHPFCSDSLGKEVGQAALCLSELLCLESRGVLWGRATGKLCCCDPDARLSLRTQI